jgi:hypothetical protein
LLEPFPLLALGCFPAIPPTSQRVSLAPSPRSVDVLATKIACRRGVVG